MSEPSTHPHLTRLLQAWSGGDARAADEVLALVYDRLRQIAAQRVRMAHPREQMAPTELANEVIANLLEADVSWQDRAHFFKTVAVAMRNFLHDLARRDAAAKHGGGQIHVTLSAAELEPGDAINGEVESLHETLAELRAMDARKADVVELHFLVGLGLEEVAQTLEVSLATVNRDLRFARAWMRERLGG
jgi:RNA polymerase sigma factor (TIGR02999 family)